MEQERDHQRGARLCPQCATSFTCGIAAGDSRCWCFDLPAVLPVRADTTCLCPACLARVVQQEQEIRQ